MPGPIMFKRAVWVREFEHSHQCPHDRWLFEQAVNNGESRLDGGTQHEYEVNQVCAQRASKRTSLRVLARAARSRTWDGIHQIVSRFLEQFR
jgi:hypothetical protein